MKNISSRVLLSLIAISLLFSVFQNCGESSHTDMSSEGETLDVLNEKSRKIRLAHCASCHEGATAQAEPSRIMDDQWLIDNRWIVPGDAQGSPLFQALFAGMPKSSAPLSEDKIGMLERWIDLLAFDGRNLANIEISDGLTFDFGSLATGSSSEHAFTLTNTGEVTAVGLFETGIAAPFHFKGGAFPGTGATCLPVLAGKTSCTIIVQYSPSSAGNHSDTIEVNYNNGLTVKTAIRNVIGSSSGVSLASLTLSDSPSFNFGAASVSTPADKTFTVTNSGAAAATSLTGSGLAAPFAFKGGTYPGTGGTCSTTLGTSATCTVVVRFAPTANGAASGTLSINYNNGSGARTISTSLTGLGSGAGTPVYYSAVRAILNTSCTGCHGSTSSESWGSSYASLLAFKKSGQSSAAIVPGSLTNSRLAKRITAHSVADPQMGVSPYGSLSGADKQTILNWIAGGALNDPTGGTPAVLMISNSPSYNFGNVVSGSSADHSFTVTNTGGSAANSVAGSGLALPFKFKGGAYPGTGGTCGSLIPISGTCTVIVSFAPTAPGTVNDTLILSFTTNSQSLNSTRDMSGTGTGLPLANLFLNGGAAHAFGVTNVGAVKDKSLILLNSGSAKATSITGSGLSGMYKFKGGTFPGTGGTCTATLNAGASCTVLVTFAPTSAGNHVDTAIVNYHNGASSQSASAAVSGIGVATGSGVYYSDVRKILTRSCASCHSADWGSTYASLLAFKKPTSRPTSALAGGMSSRFVARITGSTMGPQMGTGGNGSLSAGDRAALLAWIADGMPNDPVGTMTQDFRPFIGDRYYVSSVLQKVYGDHPNLVRPYVKQVLVRSDLFGAPCHRQDTQIDQQKTTPAMYDTCTSANSPEMRLDAETSPFISTVRESIRLTSCLRIADSIANTPTALASAGLTSTSPIDHANVGKIYELFYPGAQSNMPAIDDLVDLGQSAITRSTVVASPGKTKLLEGWRFVHLALCMSPGWQAP